MIVTGISVEDFRTVTVDVAHARYAGNLATSVTRIHSPRRFTTRVVALDSGARSLPAGESAPGARRSWSGRRMPAACWHAYRDVMLGIFSINADARIYSGLAKYVGLNGFLEDFPATAGENIGSLASPAYMPELCDCDSATREHSYWPAGLERPSGLDSADSYARS